MTVEDTESKRWRELAEAVPRFNVSLAEGMLRALDEIEYQRKLLDELRTENRELRTELAAEVRGRVSSINELRVALDEACNLADEHIFVPGAPPQQFPITVTIDTGKPYRDKARVAELRKMAVDG